MKSYDRRGRSRFVLAPVQGYSLPGSRTRENTRNNKSVYLNLKATSRGIVGALALRHERYSDFAHEWPRHRRYAFTPTFALRAVMASNGSGAVAGLSFYTITTTNTLSSSTAPALWTGTFPVSGSAAARADPLSRSRLLRGAQPEHRCAAVAGSPTATDHDGRFVPHRYRRPHRVLVEPATGPMRLLLRQQAAQGVRRRGALLPPMVDTRTAGVDVVSTFAWNFAQGARADLDAGLPNHNDNEVQGVAASPAVLSGQEMLVDRQSINRLTVGLPKDKLSLTGDYTQGAGMAAPVTRYEFTVPQNDPAGAGPELRPAGAGSGSERASEPMAPDGRHRQRDQPSCRSRRGPT
jgi:iron complex outermembrane receptor protein